MMDIDKRVTGKTRVFGIIGNPVEHSISPQLHNSISMYREIDAVYVPFKVDKNALGAAVSGLRALNVSGFNVTIPFKNEILAFLDEISEDALLMEAVNTVKNVDGKLLGYNTDAEGFARALKEEACIGFKGNKVVLIGAGGAARAIAVKAALDGAKSITVVNRTAEKAGEIVNIINGRIANMADCCGLNDSSVEKRLKESDIIINTTSVGMHPDTGKSPVGSAYVFSEGQVVCDIIYNPVKTRFLEDAGKRGNKVINGLGMLFFQGIKAYEIWMDISFSREETRAIYKSFEGIMTNK